MYKRGGYARQDRGFRRFLRAGGVPQQDRSLPAGEVIFHEKIGAHDLTVTHVLDQRGFVDWVENYLREAGVDNPAIPDPMKAVVSEYLRDRFEWFVFDVIDAGTEVKSKEAIQYRFATDRLYYPLRITRSEEGDTNIRIIVVSPGLVELPRLRGRRSRVRLTRSSRKQSPITRGLEANDISHLRRKAVVWPSGGLRHELQSRDVAVLRQG